MVTKALNNNCVVRIELFRNRFSKEICTLVPDEKTLSLISSDTANWLNHLILNRWTRDSINAFVFFYQDELVGFATLSTSEWSLPDGHCEICHMVIRKEFRRRGFGTMMLIGLQNESRRLGYGTAVGRVNAKNLAAAGMLQKNGWKKARCKWAGTSNVWFFKRS